MSTAQFVTGKEGHFVHLEHIQGQMHSAQIVLAWKDID